MDEVHQLAAAALFEPYQAEIGGHFTAALAEADQDDGGQIGPEGGRLTDQSQTHTLQHQAADQGLLRADVSDEQATEEGRAKKSHRTGGEHHADLEIAPGKFADDFRYRRADEDRAGAEEREVGEEGGEEGGAHGESR